MSVAVRLVAFALALAVVFGAATLAGAELDPSVDESADDHGAEAAEADGHDTAPPGSTALPGLAVAEGGYRLVPERTELARSAATAFRFRIVDTAGETVRNFDLEQNRRMHLIIVRRDFTGFQHLHPRQLADGSWAVDVNLPEGGVYRALADFVIGGKTVTLGTDVFVPGRFDSVAMPAVASTSEAGAGYEISLASAPPRAGGTTDVRFTVSRNGRPVDSVEPYLGADGHLVVLREHDQAYLHTHPEGEPGGPGPITFGVEYPSAGRYRLFLQFRDGGKVRTAAFSQVVEGPTSDIEDAADGHE